MDAGTYQLPTLYTAVPDLWIDLPPGYRVRSVGQRPNDDFFFYRPDDPGTRDTTVPSEGLLRIFIGPGAVSHHPDSSTVRRRAAIVVGQPVNWLVWRGTGPRGHPYYNRLIASEDLFARISPELARDTIRVQIYVGGSDSSRVAELVSAVSTLRLSP